MGPGIPLTSLKNTIHDPIDLLILCASFEDRCLSVANELSSYNVGRAVVFFLEEFDSHSLPKRQSISSFLKCPTEEVSLPHSNPRQTADRIFDTLAIEFSTYRNVLIDITTFTHESLLVLLYALTRIHNSSQSINLVYTGAKTYTGKDGVVKNLSYDPVDLRSVMGYLGQFEPTVPLHLIVMLGFEYERAQQIIDAFEPDQISIGYGGSTESVSTRLYDLNVQFKDKLISIYSESAIQEFEHSLVDPIVTMKDLESIVGTYPNYNTVIAPLNTKISTIGAGLLAIQRPEIQVCYMQMRGYNTDSYSSASENCFVIPFESLTSP